MIESMIYQQSDVTWWFLDRCLLLWPVMVMWISYHWQKRTWCLEWTAYPLLNPLSVPSGVGRSRSSSGSWESFSRFSTWSWPANGKDLQWSWLESWQPNRVSLGRLDGGRQHPQHFNTDTTTTDCCIYDTHGCPHSHNNPWLYINPIQNHYISATHNRLLSNCQTGTNHYQVDILSTGLSKTCKLLQNRLFYHALWTH